MAQTQQETQIGNELTGQAKLFKSHICDSLCKLCDKIVDNSFCRLLFIANRTAFIKFLTYILSLEASADSRVLELRKFDAFSSIICGQICTQRTPRCVPTGNQPECYDAFLRQAGEELNLHHRALIYEKYAGINVGLIGIDYDLNDLDDLQDKLKSKARKSIRRKIKNAVKKIDKAIPPDEKTNKAPAATQVVVKPKIKTSCFYNNNPEWRAELERIFADEAYN